MFQTAEMFFFFSSFMIMIIIIYNAISLIHTQTLAMQKKRQNLFRQGRRLGRG